MSCKHDPDKQKLGLLLIKHLYCSVSEWWWNPSALYRTVCQNKDCIKKEMLFNSGHLKSPIIKVMEKMAFTAYSQKKEETSYIMCPQRKGRLDIKFLRNNFRKTFPRKKQITAIFIARVLFSSSLLHHDYSSGCS